MTMKVHSVIVCANAQHKTQATHRAASSQGTQSQGFCNPFAPTSAPHAPQSLPVL